MHRGKPKVVVFVDRTKRIVRLAPLSWVCGSDARIEDDPRFGDHNDVPFSQVS